jgi:hypothetical protein
VGELLREARELARLARSDVAVAAAVPGARAEDA